jgi:predicted nucleic acid-binding protein
VSPPPPGPIATGPIFLDSNVLLYSISADPRAEIARRALAVGDVISVQVLNEFANVVRRKQVLSVAEIRDAEDRFCRLFAVLPITLALHQQGLAIADRYGFSIYDALIVAAALSAGCRTLYTEDLQHGQVLENTLTVINPFV